jgi:hypothetical protein
MPQSRTLNQEISLSVIKTACSNCNLRELCLPFGLSLEELERLDDLISTRRRIKRGDHLYRPARRSTRFTRSAAVFQDRRSCSRTAANRSRFPDGRRTASA